MNKKQFLKQLKKALGRGRETANIINYYDELIEEAKLNGELEVDVIARLGTIESIVASISEQPKDTYKTSSTKANKQTNVVLTITSKVVVIILSLFLLIVLASVIIANSINIVQSVYKLFTNNDVLVKFYYGSEIIFTIGVILIAIFIIIKVTKEINRLGLLLGKLLTIKKAGSGNENIN